MELHVTRQQKSNKMSEVQQNAKPDFAPKAWLLKPGHYSICDLWSDSGVTFLLTQQLGVVIAFNSMSAQTCCQV